MRRPAQNLPLLLGHERKKEVADEQIKSINDRTQITSITSRSQGI